MGELAWWWALIPERPTAKAELTALRERIEALATEWENKYEFPEATMLECVADFRALLKKEDGHGE